MKKTNHLFSGLTTCLFIIILCGLTWWSKDFFAKNTFMNNGDTVFQVFPKDAFYSQLFKWDENLSNGLGREMLFSVSIYLDAAYFMLNSLKIPLWVLNRLWIAFPTFIFGCALFSLFRRFSFDRKYRNLSGFIGVGYVMLAPVFSISPVVYLALAAFVYIFCIFIDALRVKAIRGIDIAVLALLSLFLPFSLRLTYYLPFLLLVYLIYHSVIFRPALSRRFIGRLGILIFVLVLVNAYLIAPAFFSNLSRGIDLKMSYVDNFAYQSRSSMVDDLYQRRALAPHDALRLISSSDNNLLSYPFDNGGGCFLSFVFPVISILLLLKRNIKKEIFLLIIFTQTLLFFTVITHFRAGVMLYKFFEGGIPGLWVHNPAYALILYSVFNGILIGVTIQTMLIWIEGISEAKAVKSFLRVSLMVLLFYTLIFVHGRNVIFDTYPFSGPMGNFMYGNHNPYFKVPETYSRLRDYLLRESEKGDRILNLPIVYSNYCIYTWYPYHNMPELVGYYSPIPAAGLNGSAEASVLKPFFNLKADKSMLTGLSAVMRSTNFKYVIVHRDYTISGFFQAGRDSAKYLDLLSKDPDFIKVLDNDNFCLFKLREYYLTKKDVPGVSKITLVKINPTKYLARVERAKEPFWLTLDVSFHNQWKIYRAGEADFKNVIGNSKLKNSEKRLVEFSPQDIRFLFEKPLNAEHKIVKDYAKGWRIEPEKLDLGKDLNLVIYFWPQSLFYLGLGISLVTLLICLGYLMVNLFAQKS